MSKKSLKSKATSGVLWNAVEKFSVRFGQFIMEIVLARILLPEHFGLIGMLSIFLAISQSFIDSGMEKGLIQKKDRTDVDFSTVFVFNLVISCIVYAILFVSAPFIASFFEQPQLVSLARVLGLNIIINSFAIVQRARLQINVDFKTLAKANVLGVFIGGGLAIVAAEYEFGVWSLVIKTLTASGITVAGLWYFSYWRPSIKFSKSSFKELFNFGYKILLTGLYARGLQEAYNVSIGKAFTADKLGYYTRAKAMAQMSAGTITKVLQQVTFPILSSLQDDKQRMVKVYRRMIKMTAFIILPAMTLISILAEPIILILLTEKWIEAVPLLKWLALSKITYPISVINMNILNAIGRSDLFLKVDLSKFPLIVIALIVTIPIGVEAMVIGQLVTSFIFFFINAYLPGRMFGYGAFDQLQDMAPVIFATLTMGLSVYYLLGFIDNTYYQLFIGTFLGSCIYLIITYYLEVDELDEFINLIKNKIRL